MSRALDRHRVPQIALIVSTFVACWLGMQVVHELGHVLAAFCAGETVHKVILHPLVISRTDVSHDRHALPVIWGGPVLGSLFLLGFLAVARSLRRPMSYLFQFFAGFCLIANGAYVGVGSFDGVGDAGDLLRYGAARWTLILFGLVGMPAGLFLWNGLGDHFGLGKSHGAVDRRAVGWMLGVASLIVVVEVVAS